MIDASAASRWCRRTAVASLALALGLGGCAHRLPDREAARWSQAQQMVVVVTPDWNADHGELHAFERVGATWRETEPSQPVMLGRSGSAWGLGLQDPQPDGPRKREGDGRSPAGVFTIGPAFGYATTASTALPYEPMQATSYCVDVSGSRFYNRIVDADVVGTDAVAGATEPMRRDLHADGDQRYRLGFVIEHNAQARPMGGSCIFAHLWKSPSDPTTGCTAMAPETMDRVLGWLRPDRHPVFVLLPRSEYLRLQVAWQLPSIARR